LWRALRMVYTEDVELHTALLEDVNEGRIWFKIADLKPQLTGRRRIVRVARTGSLKRGIYCEALYADKYYVKRWQHKLANPNQDRMFFISEWYRNQLAIHEKPGVPVNITLEISDSGLWQVYACLQHPQIVVFVATILGIVGAGLGLIGLGLGLIGIRDWIQAGLPIGTLIAIGGFLVTIFGIIKVLERNKTR